jgi:hypothetical protein
VSGRGKMKGNHGKSNVENTGGVHGNLSLTMKIEKEINLDLKD